MTDNTKRFSDRVEDYTKYRSHYPDSLIHALEGAIHLDASKIIADIGSGTGLSSLLFLKKGLRVFGVEPNTAMREAAEQLLAGFQNFTSINGSAEITTLPNSSIDIVFIGQAFHWFDPEKSKIELNRILSPNGHIVIAWNVRSTKTKFQQEYEQMLYTHIDGYKTFSESKIDESLITQFFYPKLLNKASLENSQSLDFNGLVGRLRSSSYFPKTGEKHEIILNELKILFDKNKCDNAKYLTKDSNFWLSTLLSSLLRLGLTVGLTQEYN